MSKFRENVNDGVLILEVREMPNKLIQEIISRCGEWHIVVRNGLGFVRSKVPLTCLAIAAAAQLQKLAFVQTAVGFNDQLDKR